MTQQWWRHGALELAAAIRAGEATSREVVTAHLERIEAVNPAVNAVVHVLAEEALVAADAADAALAAGGEVGPLHGVPCTVKENIDLSGTATTWGVSALSQAVSPVDAPVVARIRAAGAIPIGRTNLPDMALRVNTESQLHGRTSNPWDATRTAGGSSGGEAAALATGMSPLGLGNDVGGSLRNPAHCCGVASIKPTVGVVPWATVIPPEDRTISFQLMAVEGVLARRVADVRAGLLAVAGYDARDPQSLDGVLRRPDGGQRLRVAVLDEPGGGSTSPAVAAAVRRAGDALADAGHAVEPACPPGYEKAIELWGGLLGSDLRVSRPILGQVMGEGGLTFLDHALDHLPDLGHAALALAHVERHAVARGWSQWFADYDVLLSPVWTETAFPADFDVASRQGAVATLELMRPVLPANLLGTPAAVVPAGLDDGLPVGVQVMGWRFDDLRCLAVAEQIEQALGTLTPIDPRG